MSSRELARVLIKVMGLVVLVVVVILVIQLISLFLPMSRSDSSFRFSYLWPILLAVILWVLMAVFLLRQADWIAERLRMGSDDPSRAFADGDGSRITEAGLVTVGAKLVGIYAYLRSLDPIAHLLYSLAPIRAGDQEKYSGFLRSSLDRIQLLIEAGLYVLAGTVLFVGARRIGRWVRHTFIATKATDETPPPA